MQQAGLDADLNEKISRLKSYVGGARQPDIWHLWWLLRRRICKLHKFVLSLCASRGTEIVARGNARNRKTKT